MKREDVTTSSIASCPACGNGAFAERRVLWPELVTAWELSPDEEAYINRQQGFHCTACGNNLRMMGLAAAITSVVGSKTTLAEWCRRAPETSLLEINTAGLLTQFLSLLPGHQLVEYPAFDMTDLAIPSGTFDLVVHSDSLEHVPDPVKGLAECRRVLRPNGCCVFTVPVVVGRMTRSRAGLPASYHGRADMETDDQLVRHEFGADTWKYVLRAGFNACEIVAFEYPAAITLVARR